MGSVLRVAPFAVSSGNGKTNGSSHVPGRIGGESERSVELSPRPRKPVTIDQLRDGYDRVLEVMDAIQAHFERQDHRAEQMSQSVERVASTLERLAETQSVQRDALASISTQVDAARKHASTLSATLMEMPASMHAQAEMVRAIAKRLEVSQETDVQLVGSLERFGAAVDALRESTSAHVATLHRMQASDSDMKESLKGVIREQGKRFFAAMVVVGVLGAAALGGLTYAILRLAAA